VRPGEAWLAHEALAEPSPGEVLVHATHSGVSRGTEALVYRGGVPESEHARMRCPFQLGDFPGPVKYGYASVGEVEGRPVFCLHPHQDRYVVPRSAVVPLPPEVPPHRAVLAANCETALNAVWDAGELPERAMVIGAGVVGSLTAWLLGKQVRVQLVDVEARRAEVAQALGVAFALPADAWTDVPLIVHASATRAGLVQALDAAAFEGTVLELSWFGAREVSLPLGGAFHSRRLTLRASQVGSVAPRQRAMVSHRERLKAALRYLADPACEVLLDSHGAFADLPNDLARLASAAGPLCHVVHYDKET